MQKVSFNIVLDHLLNENRLFISYRLGNYGHSKPETEGMSMAEIGKYMDAPCLAETNIMNHSHGHSHGDSDSDGECEAS